MTPNDSASPDDHATPDQPVGSAAMLFE